MHFDSEETGSYDAEFDIGKLYVWGVSILIGFVGYTSQIFVYWKYLGGFTLQTFVVLGIFNFLLHLLYYNYYLAVTVPPGHVPIGWEPPRNGVNVYELKRDTLKPRYCRMCKGFKPPRTHHCSDCDRCVLKMDHHCPWTNNCVGFHNQGHFLRFIYTVDVTCAMAILLHFLRLYELMIDAVNGTYYVRQPTQVEVAFLIIDMSLATLVLLFVGILSCYHLYLVGRNTTTIESREKERVARLIKAKKCKPMPYPYHLGLVRNFKSVFGQSILTWWVPKAMGGNGTDFAIKDGLVPPVYWPPPGYTRTVGDPAKVEQRCDTSKTIFQDEHGTKVITEVDDDGEMVIRQYNIMNDPAALECGGDNNNQKPRRNGLSDSGKDEDSNGDDEKSEGWSSGWDDEDDSDDDMVLTKMPSMAVASGISIPGRSAHAPGSAMYRRTAYAYANRQSDENGSDGEDSEDNTPLSRVMSRRNTQSQPN